MKKCGVIALNVYDFDGTVYNGESTFDFYIYCVKHHPKCIKFAFIVVKSLIKYKLCLIDEKQLYALAEKYVADFISCCSDANALAVKFWKTHKQKICSFYLQNQKESDIIVSASFGFLLRPLFEELGIKRYILSEIDFDSKKVVQLCYRKNKIGLFKSRFPNERVDDVYTDSLNDKPLMSLAEGNVYLVKNGRVKKYIRERKNEE